MSSYSSNQIKSYAKSAIKNLLPLDDESVSQMVDYAISNLRSRNAITNHFMNLLGESPDALEFITRFSNMLFGDPNEKQKPDSSELNRQPCPSTSSNQKSSGPPKVLKVLTTNGSRTKILKTKIVKKNGNAWNSNSPEPIKQENKPRLSKSKGANTSELFELKPSIVKATDFKKKDAKMKLDNLKDLDAALLELEVMNTNNGNADDQDIRVCNCNATRHPLFDMFPNCLNCGKIICAKEGLQPCSFCGKPLISNEERIQIVDVLQKEKDIIKGVKKSEIKQIEKPNQTKKKNIIKISINSTGQNNYKVQDQVFKKLEKKRQLEREKEEKTEEEKKEIDDVQKELEYYTSVKGKDNELLAAEERLDTLLNFQDNGAERTKIVDNAADYEAPSGNGNLWASPLERALQLKRQQKQLRKIEEGQQQRSGRGKKVMDMSIRDGKVYLREVAVDSGIPENLSDDDEIKEIQQKVNDMKLKDFEEEAQNNWDYEKASDEFHKPVYLGNADKDSEENVVKGQNFPTLGNIVQLGDAEQQENVLFNMIGV